MEEGGHASIASKATRKWPEGVTRSCTSPLAMDGDAPGAQLSTGPSSLPSCKKLRNRTMSRDMSRLWPSLSPYKVLSPQPLEDSVNPQMQSHIGHRLRSAYPTMQSIVFLRNRTRIYSWESLPLGTKLHFPDAFATIFLPVRCKREFCGALLGSMVKAALDPFCFPPSFPLPLFHFSSLEWDDWGWLTMDLELLTTRLWCEKI